MKRLTISELRDILPVGTVFTAERTGKINLRHSPNKVKTRRVVVAFTRQEIRSEFVEERGTVVTMPFKGSEFTLGDDGSITVTRVFSEEERDDYLLITEIGR